MYKGIRQNLFPLLAALIWGTAFVAQSIGANYLQPFSFNAIRSAIAFVALLILCIFRRRLAKSGALKAKVPWRRLIIAGLCCGLALTVAANLQQKGLETTSSGKAGFITALYIVIVPLLGLLRGKRATRLIWISVLIAVLGLYCLCINESFSISEGDFYIFLCALCFSLHIIFVDGFTAELDCIELSCAQFLVVTILSAVGAFFFETPTLESIRICLLPLLYVGLLSSAVAYTLQILAQKDSNPTVVSLLLSLESVFATVSGAIILGDKMSGREYLGCILMLLAVVLAQLPEKKRA